jgi:hypothetical protein
LKLIAVVRRFNDTEDFDIVSKRMHLEYAVLKGRGPKTDPCGIPETTSKTMK